MGTLTTPAKRLARRRVFTQVSRGLRALRNLTRQAAARLMGVQTRRHDHFEAGDVRLDLERLFDFAAVTDSDPLAIVASLYLERPEIALRCADNKLMFVQALCVERLIDLLGDRIVRVDPATWMDIHDRCVDELVREMDARDARARRWLTRSDEDPDPKPSE